MLHICTREWPHCACASCYQVGIQHNPHMSMGKWENLIAFIVCHCFQCHYKPSKYDVVDRASIKTHYCKWTVLCYLN